MRPGETVEIIKGEHKGETGVIKGSDSYYYFIQILSDKGDETKTRVSLHRSEVKSNE